MISFATLNPKQRIYLTAAGWLVALGLLAYFIILPLLAQIKKDGLELAQKKQDMELFYQEQQNLEKAQKDYLAMQSEIGFLPAIMPAGDALKFIFFIEQTAQRTSNQQAVSLSEDKAGTAKNTVDFQISLRGNFPDLMRFLVYLENAPYYNEIKTLQAQRLSSKDDIEVTTGDINTILTVSVHQ